MPFQLSLKSPEDLEQYLRAVKEITEPLVNGAFQGASMLRAKAMGELFTANLDDVGHAIFITTTNGMLLGNSAGPPAQTKLVKRACALGGLTWRIHALPRGGEGAEPAPSTAAEPLRVVRVNEGPGTLTIMVVEIDGRACAFEYVRETLMVGVFGPERGAAAEKEEEEGPAGDGEEADAEEGAAAAERAEGARREEDEMIRKLMVKAGAMAGYMREELKEFKMPKLD